MTNTVSVEAGNQTVTGTLTGFVGYPGDTFNCNGLSVPITVSGVPAPPFALGCEW